MTLTGYIDTYAAKLAAERAVKRVRGVKGVANDLEVWLKIGRTDADIARDAVRALELRGTVPETIQVAVHDGHITLTGKAGWVYQARHAEERFVTSKASAGSSITSRWLTARRCGMSGTGSSRHSTGMPISMPGTWPSTSSDVALLTGSVATWQQRETAERAAASAPGITRVKNEILVEPLEPVDEIC